MADETRECLMNIHWHRQLLLSGVSKYAIAVALAFPDATRAKVGDATIIRWARRAGTVFGWALVFAAGFGSSWAILRGIGWLMGWGFGA